MTSHIDMTFGKRGKSKGFVAIGNDGRDYEARKAEKTRKRNDKAQSAYRYGLQSDTHAECAKDILQKAPNRHGMSKGMGAQRIGTIGSARFSSSVGPRVNKPYDAKNPEWNAVKAKHELKRERKRNLEERRARKARKKEKTLLEAITK